MPTETGAPVLLWDLSLDIASTEPRHASLPVLWAFTTAVAAEQSQAVMVEILLLSTRMHSALLVSFMCLSARRPAGTCTGGSCAAGAG